MRRVVIIVEYLILVFVVQGDGELFEVHHPHEQAQKVLMLMYVKRMGLRWHFAFSTLGWKWAIAGR